MEKKKLVNRGLHLEIINTTKILLNQMYFCDFNILFLSLKLNVFHLTLVTF